MDVFKAKRVRQGERGGNAVKLVKARATCTIRFSFRHENARPFHTSVTSHPNLNFCINHQILALQNVSTLWSWLYLPALLLEEISSLFISQSSKRKKRLRCRSLRSGRKNSKHSRSQWRTV